MAFQDKVQAQSPTLMPQAFPSVPFVELRQSLPSHVAIISPFVDQLLRFIARFRTGDGEVTITVEDEGQGFDSETVPDPTAPENRLLTCGRGIYLMKTLMDEVRFERGGAVVHMQKKPIPL